MKFFNSINELNQDLKIENELSSDELSQVLEISFHFKLSVDRQTELESLVNSGVVLTPEELFHKFSVSSSEVDGLIKFLFESGFTNIRKSFDNCTVFASGTLDIISRSLRCKISKVRQESSQSFVVSSVPSLPNSISLNIDSINGLQPLIEYKKNFNRENRISFLKRFRENKFQKLVNYSRPYLVDAIKSAYNSLNVQHDGRGQTIGILIDRFPNSADMIRFWKLNGQPIFTSRITNINVNNYRIEPPNGEETLDAQWTSGIATGARINIYATGILTFSAVERGLDRIFQDVLRNPSLRQISISLGIGERMLTPGELLSKNDKYLRLRALGVNIFVSSGDSGSHPSGVLQVEFPASNPNVISVGGTNLNINGNGTLISESAWSKSGGGQSYVYQKQSYQNALSGLFRIVPDVAAVGDQSTGVCVVLNGLVYQFGGTSVGAPIWAGFCAIINSARSSQGKKPIGFLLPHLYSLMNTQNFRDIKSGNNGQYPSITGHDMVTGLGTPNIQNLISALINL
jgi:kumamolisin